jgi:hypothetical protein
MKWAANALAITGISILPFLPSGSCPIVPDNVSRVCSVVFFITLQISNIIAFRKRVRK